ncbi:MAG TPA: UbiD family decarboxylase [Xanthobacteraceae bacterium]|jgi:UbiD family decarboxylase
MRAFLAALEACGELQRVKRCVDPRFEIAAVLSLRKNGPAQLFERVRGYAMPLVGNLLNSRERMTRALGIGRSDLHDFCVAALRQPIAPVVVREAPWQAVEHRRDVELARLLPVPTWFEREAGPYITAGVAVAKDPDTGKRNVSIARLRLEGGTRLMAGIAHNHHLYRLAQRAKGLGAPLEVAVTIGSHPAVLLASQMYVDLGEDELAIAGALRREPLRLARCRTVDLEVPAEAEIVLEGELGPDELIEEGPVSEFPGFYVSYGPGLAMHLRCVSHRADAVYQAILPGFAPEHCLLGAVAIEAVLCHALQRVIPCVRRVLVTDGGMGRLHAIISMHRPALGEAKRAILVAMGQVNLLKLVIAVEADIDPEDWTQVEWSLAARFRASEDLIVLPGVKADRCDPVHENATVTKIGMVATTRPGDGAAGSRSELASPPRDVLERVRKELDEY